MPVGRHNMHCREALLMLQPHGEVIDKQAVEALENVASTIRLQ